jgi:hypothetical protein
MVTVAFIRERIMPRGFRFGIVAFVLTTLLTSRSAQAHHVTVQQDGGGDATTIQGGIDFLLAAPVTSELDTIVIMPGDYREAVDINLGVLEQKLIGDSHIALPLRLLAPGGFRTTAVGEIHVEPVATLLLYDDYLAVEGLSVHSPVVLGREERYTAWTFCRFETGYQAQADAGSLRDVDRCEFHGRVLLSGFVSPGPDEGLHDCQFIDAPLELRDDDIGDITVVRCTFENADTAAIIYVPHYNAVHFMDCSFSRVNNGVIYGGFDGGGYTVAGCRFEDVTGDALRFDTDHPPSAFYFMRLQVVESRFQGCGSAIQIHSPAPISLELRADTVQTTSRAGIVADVGSTAIDHLLVSDCAWDGVALNLRSLIPGEAIALPVDIRQSRFQHNAGSGLIVRDTMNAINMIGGVRTVGCEFLDNAGSGLVCQGESLLVSDNVAHGNRQSGFDVTLSGLSLAAAIARNSAVLNGGTGLVVHAAPSSAPSSVANDLSAFNDGLGFDVSGPIPATMLHNDAWSNTLGAGVPAGPDNLQLDPGLCDAMAGDDHVQDASPCAPSGQFGQIGALGVGCDASNIEAALLDRRDGRGAPAALSNDRPLARAAALGSRVVDVKTLDPGSAQLSGLPALATDHEHQPSTRDVNHDGQIDLAMWFPGGALAVDGHAALEISTFSGLRERGDVADRVPGQNSLKPAPGPLGQDQDPPQFRLLYANFSSSSSRVEVVLTTPRPEPVTLELFDVTGRRIARHEAMSATAGATAVTFAPVARLQNGVYLFRATYAGIELTSRIIVLR